MARPEMTAAISMPEPVYDNQVKLKTAPSGVGFATTGGTLATSLSRPSTGNFQVANGFTKALNQSVPHTSSNTQTMIQGMRHAHFCAVVSSAFCSSVLGAVLAESSRVRNA